MLTIANSETLESIVQPTKIMIKQILYLVDPNSSFKYFEEKILMS